MKLDKSLTPMTEEMYEKFTGHKPENDDIERVSCDKVGCSGHTSCGWNHVTMKPIFYGGNEGVLRYAETTVGDRLVMVVYMKSTFTLKIGDVFGLLDCKHVILGKEKVHKYCDVFDFVYRVKVAVDVDQRELAGVIRGFVDAYRKIDMIPERFLTEEYDPLIESLKDVDPHKFGHDMSCYIG
jgi:hypothetical protein